MNLITQHPMGALAAFYVFSAAVSSMPEPVATSGRFYVWLYHFTHVLSGDLSQYIGSRTPRV